MAVTNVRSFDGVDDFIDIDNGVANITAPISMAVLTRRIATGSGFEALLRPNVLVVGNCLMLDTSTDLAEYNGDGSWSIGPSLPIADNWCIIGMNKPTGAGTNARFHKLVCSTGTWAHSVGSAGVADATAQTKWMMGGSSADGDCYGGYIAAAAVWDRELTDGDFESLRTTWQGWLDEVPKAAWRLDQASAGTPVTDQMLGGADQTAITGTSVVSEDIPSFSFGAAAASGVVPSYRNFPKEKLRSLV